MNAGNLVALISTEMSYFDAEWPLSKYESGFGEDISAQFGMDLFNYSELLLGRESNLHSSIVQENVQHFVDQVEKRAASWVEQAANDRVFFLGLKHLVSEHLKLCRVLPQELSKFAGMLISGDLTVPRKSEHFFKEYRRNEMLAGAIYVLTNQLDIQVYANQISGNVCCLSIVCDAWNKFDKEISKGKRRPLNYESMKKVWNNSVLSNGELCLESLTDSIWLDEYRLSKWVNYIGTRLHYSIGKT